MQLFTATIVKNKRKFLSILLQQKLALVITFIALHCQIECENTVQIYQCIHEQHDWHKGFN